MFSYINDYHQLGEFQKALSAADLICLDVETTGLNPFKDDLVLLQVNLNGAIFVFDCTLLENKYITYIIQLIKDSKKTVIGHNIKFDVKFLKQKTGEMLENVYDTYMAEIIIYNGVGDRYPSLKDLVYKYCSAELDKDERQNFIGNKEVTTQKLIYSALDVKYLYDIFYAQQNLIDERKLRNVINLEMRTLPAVVSMELTGITIDTTKWLELSKLAFENSERLSNEIRDDIFSRIDFSQFANMYEAYKALGMRKIVSKKKVEQMEQVTSPEFFVESLRNEFQTTSPNQLKAGLKLIGLDLNSTMEEFVNELYEKTEDDILRKIIEYRGELKKYTTSGEEFLTSIESSTGRIHSEFNQMGARSGRFSSANPNLQNIIADKKYRSCFIAGAGKMIVGGDFSQEEYRLAGAVSGEQAIIDAYKSGIDMHTKTASIVNQIPVEQVTKDIRQHAKTINFSILYGTTEFGMARKQKFSIDEARKIINLFYSGYPTLYAFQDAVKKKILEIGYSSTLLGRKRFFENKTFFSGNDAWKQKQKQDSSIQREGFNHIIQGTGGDVIKEALSRLYFENPFGDKFHLLLTVHDEIECEVDEDIKEQAQEFLVYIMTSTLQKYLGEIPAVVESYISNCWEH